MFQHVAIETRRKAIQKEIEMIAQATETLDDTHILEHAQTVLSQLSATLKTHLTPCEEVPKINFTNTEKFAPAQKNEKQLRFFKTTHSAGRKQKLLPLP